MVFSTVSFLYAFLPLFLISYILLPWRNAVALAFSLLFFAWGESAYLVLLLLVIGANHVFGLGLTRLHAKSVLAAGLAFNLLVLGYYKYFGFLVSDVLSIEAPEGLVPPLPLGISFFIFQCISYLVDVYRGTSKPARSVFDLALYVAMFPQLIAGPIVRYDTVEAALRERAVTLGDVARGLKLFIVGLGYKVLVANHCAQVADAAFGLELEQVGTAVAWLGIVSYTLQIFFDFAGYSLMAIGLGRVMGFHFPQNFNYPYIADSITEFWRRWHMSLSSWFRDYLYIPLGGNRNGRFSTYRNLFLVFFLCGLWHGAAWTFIVWGMFHGALLVLERTPAGRVLERLPRPVRHAYCMLLVMVGWVLFRSETFEQARVFLARMFFPSSAATTAIAELLTNENLLWIVIAIPLCLPILERGTWKTQGEEPERRASWWRHAIDACVVLVVVGVCSTYVMSGTYNPFIYFRF